MLRTSPHSRSCAAQGTRTGRKCSLVVATLLTLGIAGATACGSDDSPVAAPAATIRMGEFFYQPAELTVARGSTVLVVNDGAAVHSWILKGPGIGTAGIAPGDSLLVDLRRVAPGRYTIFCDQAGHTQAGQIGTLTVSA
jgi:plastocyanin